MKRIHIFAIACLLLLLLPAQETLSQTRRRTTTRSTTQKKRTTETQPSSDAVSTGAARVADQIKNLTRFLYLYGRITNGFEAADDLARRNQSTPAAIEQTEKSKAAVRANLKNVREGLDQLEIQFRSTPELQRYYIKLAGVAASAAAAEDSAAANQFDQAGRSLIDVVNRLADVMLEMHEQH